MAKASQRAIARAILKRYPRSHADRLRIDVGRNTPSPLYQWMIASLLFSARIRAENAQTAADALFRKGWKSAGKMAGTSWEERVRVLSHAGYSRYDESTSRYIGDATAMLLERYHGDLRNLRKAARRDPQRERALLKEFKGIGDVGADLFFREAQVGWDELYPFADGRALVAAGKFGLAADAVKLAQLVDSRRDLPRLLAGLVLADIEGRVEEVVRDAG